MKIRRRNLILIAAVAGLTSGFIIRKARLSALSSGPARDRAGLTSSVSKEHRTLSRAAKLKEDLAISSGVAHWLLWMSALENASLADLPEMARMARGNAALRMIGARWIVLNPGNLFETLVKTGGEKEDHEGSFPRQDLGLMLFEDWTKRDPGGAVAALGRKDLPPALCYFRSYVLLNRLVPDHPELALRAAAEWQDGIHEYAVDMRFTTKWIAADPRHAAEFALAHPSGGPTRMALEIIGKTWAESDPESALAFAWSVKDTGGPSQRETLATAVINAWGARDPEKAAAWLATADRTTRNGFSGPMVEAWGRKDPAAAMTWVQENLDGSFRDDAVGSVLKGVAGKSLSAAAKLVSGMEASTARAKAAGSVAGKWFYTLPGVTTIPPEAITWLSGLDAASIKHVVGQQSWQWATTDPKSLSAFLVSPAGEEAPPWAFSAAAREMSRRNPADALEWASHLSKELRTDTVVSVLSEWQTSQPGSAMDWLRKLPAADPRRESFYFAAVRDFVFDPPAATLAAKALSAGSPAVARATVEQLSIPEDRKQELLKRLQLK